MFFADVAIQVSSIVVQLYFWQHWPWYSCKKLFIIITFTVFLQMKTLLQLPSNMTALFFQPTIPHSETVYITKV